MDLLDATETWHAFPIVRGDDSWLWKHPTLPVFRRSAFKPVPPRSTQAPQSYTELFRLNERGQLSMLSSWPTSHSGYQTLSNAWFQENTIASLAPSGSFIELRSLEDRKLSGTLELIPSVDLSKQKFRLNYGRLTIDDGSRWRHYCLAHEKWLVPQRHRLAIEIFSRVHRKCPNVRMDFYGWGDRMRQNIDDVNTRRLGHVISVNGFTQRPQSVYAVAGLSLLTSQGEGFALGVLESLAAGCPVISFNVPYGPLDLIQDGQNGALIPDGNVDAFAQRIVEILTDGDLHHRLIHNCQRSIERFSEAAVAAQWHAVLRSAIGIRTQVSDEG